MGRLQAEEMVARLSQEQALRWHLQYNHYPPIDEVFIPIAEQAIELANVGDWEVELELPNGLEKAVSFIVEGMHLESFLDENGS